MSVDLLYSWMGSVREMFGMVSRMEGWGEVMEWECEYIFLFIPLFLYSLSFFCLFYIFASFFWGRSVGICSYLCLSPGKSF